MDAAALDDRTRIDDLPNEVLKAVLETALAPSDYDWVTGKAIRLVSRKWAELIESAFFARWEVTADVERSLPILQARAASVVEIALTLEEGNEREGEAEAPERAMLALMRWLPKLQAVAHWPKLRSLECYAVSEEGRLSVLETFISGLGPAVLGTLATLQLGTQRSPDGSLPIGDLAHDPLMAMLGGCRALNVLELEGTDISEGTDANPSPATPLRLRRLSLTLCCIDDVRMVDFLASSCSALEMLILQFVLFEPNSDHRSRIISAISASSRLTAFDTCDILDGAEGDDLLLPDLAKLPRLRMLEWTFWEGKAFATLGHPLEDPILEIHGAWQDAPAPATILAHLRENMPQVKHVQLPRRPDHDTCSDVEALSVHCAERHIDLRWQDEVRRSLSRPP